MLIVEIYRRLLNLILRFLLYPLLRQDLTPSGTLYFSFSLAISILLSSFLHLSLSLSSSNRIAHTRDRDCTCNRISMTVPAGDLTTCHPLYQFTAAGDPGCTHVNRASAVYLWFLPTVHLRTGLSNDSVFALTAERLPRALLTPVIGNRTYLPSRASLFTRAQPNLRLLA